MKVKRFQIVIVALDLLSKLVITACKGYHVSTGLPDDHCTVHNNLYSDL